MSLSVATPSRDLIHRDPLFLESEWMVGNERHRGMGHGGRYRTFKADVHFKKILASPARDSWNPVYTGEFTGQVAWSFSESDWFLVSSTINTFHDIKYKSKEPIQTTCHN